MVNHRNKIQKWFVLIFAVTFPFCELALKQTAFKNKGEAWAGHANPVSHPRHSASSQVTPDSQAGNTELLTWDILNQFSKEIKLNKESKKEKYKNGTKVSVVGFMMPLQTDSAEKMTTSFLLTRNESGCCYGTTLRKNEWVYVNMAPGKTAEIVTNIPVTVEGTLELVEKNKGCFLYRMRSEKVTCTPKTDPKIC